jgi:hypothetical protein
MTHGDLPTQFEFDDVRTALARLNPAQFAELKASLDQAITELDRIGGTPFDVEEIKREGRERLAARRSK